VPFEAGVCTPSLFVVVFIVFIIVCEVGGAQAGRLSGLHTKGISPLGLGLPTRLATVLAYPYPARPWFWRCKKDALTRLENESITYLRVVALLGRWVEGLPSKVVGAQGGSPLDQPRAQV
jgi:hypothetical protein